MRSPLVAPNAHWLHQKPIGCTRNPLAASETQWLHQKPTGCTGNPLAAPEAHWLHQKPTGCARNPLAASETQWLHQKPSGCTRNPLAALELSRLYEGRDSAPIEAYRWTLLIMHIKKVFVFNLRQNLKIKIKVGEVWKVNTCHFLCCLHTSRCQQHTCFYVVSYWQ